MKRFVLFASALLILSCNVSAESLVVGVLEQPQCAKTDKLSARFLFAKERDVWRTVDDFSATNKFDASPMKWTVAFDGRNLGNIKIVESNAATRSRDDPFHRRDKLFEVPTDQKIPAIKNRSGSFAGWCAPPVYRPLVLVSQPHFSDPEKWKPFTPESSYRQRLYAPLKSAIGKLKFIVGRAGSLKCLQGASESADSYDLKLEDVVVYKGFRAASNKEIISVGLDQKKIDCDGPPLPEWSAHWFLLDRDRVHLIGKQMDLIDAGDYDADGQSELLFWYSGYNRDGYILFYDGLKKKIEYVWSYH